jgi:hypothetical protein
MRLAPILQLATLISTVAVAGRKNNANGELAAHLADLKNQTTRVTLAGL